MPAVLPLKPVLMYFLDYGKLYLLSILKMGFLCINISVMSPNFSNADYQACQVIRGGKLSTQPHLCCLPLNLCLRVRLQYVLLWLLQVS